MHRVRISSAAALLFALSSLPAVAAGIQVSPLDSHAGYRKAVERIKAGDCKSAIPILEGLRKERGNEPDVLTWLGYCQRKAKGWSQSRLLYDKALAVDPTHKSANEYLGELLVEQGDLKGARERLAVLKASCGADCAEYKELSAFIEKAEAER
jgi:predicted Zn-dependent protease